MRDSVHGITLILLLILLLLLSHFLLLRLAPVVILPPNPEGFDGAERPEEIPRRGPAPRGRAEDARGRRRRAAQQEIQDRRGPVCSCCRGERGRRATQQEIQDRRRAVCSCCRGERGRRVRYCLPVQRLGSASEEAERRVQDWPETQRAHPLGLRAHPIGRTLTHLILRNSDWEGVSSEGASPGANRGDLSSERASRSSDCEDVSSEDAAPNSDGEVGGRRRGKVRGGEFLAVRTYVGLGG